MALHAYQYQIDDIVFGRDTQIPVQKVDIQTYNVNNQDFQVQRSDENRFGIDTLTPAPLVFTMSVLQNYMLDSMAGFSNAPQPDDIFASNNSMLNALAASWKDIPLRLTWGATKPILFCDKFGKVVRIYGRPGKFTHSPRHKDGESWIDVQAEFRRSDTYAHSDDEFYVASSINTGILPNAPDPIAASRLDGDGDAWVRMLFLGPMVHPVVTYGNNILELNSTLDAGKVLEVSSYPWSRRVIDSDGINRRTEVIGDTLYLDQIRFYAGQSMNVSWTCDGSGPSTQMFFLWRESYNVI